MKEATGETSMTLVTIIAIGVIAAILAALWPTINNWINGAFNNVNKPQYTPGGQTQQPG